MKNNTSRILAQDCLISNDTWVTGINNNDLIIGPSGAGKTRGYVKPNLLQCALQGGESLIIADTKGSLIREVGPVLAAHGYRIINLDLTDLLSNTVGYNPLDYIRYDPARKKHNEQDILTLAACLIPVEAKKDPFWEQSAQLYLAALIGYVLESLPEEEHSLASVCRLYPLMDDERFYKLFQELAEENPNSFAVRTYRMTAGNEEKNNRTYASVKMFLVKNLVPLTFDGPAHLYRLKERIDFRALGREQTAVFLTISDTDRSMDRIANTFYTQALHTLMDSADRDYLPDNRLPVPVRFILDDFATNAVIPEFDKIISIIRSREVYVSLIIQSINQLYALYKLDEGKTIINNCDNCLYLGGQDIDTARFISIKANKTQDTVLNMPLNDVWLFTRGQKPRQVRKYDLKTHPLYSETPEAGGVLSAALEQISAPVPAPEGPILPDGGSDPELTQSPPFRPEPGAAGASPALFQSLAGRRQLILEKAATAERLLSGRNRAVREKLRDAQGCFSDEAVWTMVDALIQPLLNNSNSRPQKSLSEKDITCLRSFFYCSLLFSYSAPAWIPEITGTFQDLILLAQKMNYSCKADLLFDELYLALMDDSFFSWMDEAYVMLSGMPVTRSISAADEQLVRTQYWELIAQIEAESEELDQEELEREQRDNEAWLMEDPEYAREQQQRQEWIREFREPNQFCQQYLLLRSLYFDTKLPGALPQLVEQALDAYLWENSFSYFLDDKMFSDACALLDSAAQQLLKLLKDAAHS